MRLAPPRFAREDQRAAFGHEVGREHRAEEGEAHGRLVLEVEVVDGLEKRKLRAPYEAGEPGLLALRDLLRHEQGEEVAIAPLFLLGLADELAPGAAGVGEVQA